MQENMIVFENWSLWSFVGLSYLISFCIACTFIFLFILQLSELWDKRYQKEIPVFCANFLYVLYIIRSFLLGIHIEDPTLYLRLYVSLCIIFFLGFIILKNKKFYAEDSVDYKVFITKHYEDPLYFSTKNFWKKSFFQRKQERLYILVLEVPMLLLASFFTLLRTRLINYLNAYISFSIFLLILGRYYPFLIFIFFVVFLTLFFRAKRIQNYFIQMYSPTALKEIGWNMFSGFIKQTAPKIARTLTKTAVGTVAAAVVDEVGAAPVLNVSECLVKVSVYERKIELWKSLDCKGPEPIAPDLNQTGGGVIPRTFKILNSVATETNKVIHTVCDSFDRGLDSASKANDLRKDYLDSNKPNDK